jgi:hypothetical protein
MTLAGTFRADKDDDTVGPIRPAFDQRKRGGIGWPFKKILAANPIRMFESQCQLVGTPHSRHGYQVRSPV